MMKGNKRIAVAVLAILLAAAVLAVGQEEVPCTIHVQAGESIQQAIDMAPEGAVICLSAGAWEGHLSIGKSLTLRGEGAEESRITSLYRGITRHPEDKPIILVYGDRELEVVIRGIAIIADVGSERSWRVEHGISILGTPHVIIEDTVVRGSFCGIHIAGSSTTAIHGTSVQGNREVGILVEGSAHSTITDSAVAGNRGGVRIMGSAEAAISGCTISGNSGDGIALTENAVSMVADCVISDNGTYGVGLWGSAWATVTDSSICQNGDDGLYLSHSAQAAAVKCTISGNGKTPHVSERIITIQGVRSERWTRGSGVLVIHTAQVTVTDSLVSENRWCGVGVLGSARATIKGCIISGHRKDLSFGTGCGIILGSAVEVTIECNVVDRNAAHGIVLFEQPCLDTAALFSGHVMGFRNTIPSLDQEDGNGEGAVCPDELMFLMTEEGGELDRRHQQQ